MAKKKEIITHLEKGINEILIDWRLGNQHNGELAFLDREKEMADKFPDAKERSSHRAAYKQAKLDLD